jgi:hypothetical protein
MWLPVFVIPARLAADAWTRHAIARLGASILAALILVAMPETLSAVAGWTDAGCWLRDVCGLPCPGCGITTSLLALGRGDIAAAWSANPAGLAVATLLIGQALVAGAVIRSPGQTATGSASFGRLDRLMVGGLAVVWVGRLIQAVS